jgi:hypothetical protein
MGIRTLIAMSPGGVPYFSGNYICPNGNNCDVLSADKTVSADPVLVSGFFTALSNMATMSGGELQHIAFEKHQYLAQNAENLIMIMSIGINDNIDDYKNRLTLSVDLFLDNFRDLITNWTGDHQIFNLYQTLLDEADFFDSDVAYRKNCIDCQTNQDCSFRMLTGIQKTDVREKMKMFPKDAFFKRMTGLAKEFMKYRQQLKRYKQFQKNFRAAKQATPDLKIVDFAKI